MFSFSVFFLFFFCFLEPDLEPPGFVVDRRDRHQGAQMRRNERLIPEADGATLHLPNPGAANHMRVGSGDCNAIGSNLRLVALRST